MRERAMLKRINPTGIHAPAPSYSHVVEDVTRGVIHVAGQVGLTRDRTWAGPDMASQLRQILVNFDIILRELTLTRADFVKRTVYVTDMDEYFTPAVRAQIDTYFGEPVFASTVVQVQRLFAREVKIEIEAVLHRT